MTHPFILTTPVAFFIFNRPAVTERVFQAIRSARPAKLFIVADGPRDDRPGEAAKCAACREIVKRIDWPCEVERNYSDINLGCRRRVSSGIDWVFSIVEEAIILEDDCLPEPSFFRFCQEMLVYYRNNERIMMISGTNLLEECKQARCSYHFSSYTQVWGWATWKRAWDYYDVDIKSWGNSDVKKRIQDNLQSKLQYQYHSKSFNSIVNGKVDTWDYQWNFCVLENSGLSVVPSANLISNIGFGDEATHTTSVGTILNSMLVYPMIFPLRHQNLLEADENYAEECVNLMRRQQTWKKIFKDIISASYSRIRCFAKF